MANKKIYEVEVAGTDKAATTLRAFEDTFAKGGVAAAKSFGDVFKAVSRDIDVIGGQVTAGATKAISDVLGIVEAVSGGGILAPIAAVASAVGGVVYAVRAWKEEEAELVREIQKAADAEARRLDFIQQEATAIETRRRASAKDTAEAIAESAELVAVGLRASAQAQIETLRQAEAEAARLRGTGADDEMAARERLNTARINAERATQRAVAAVAEAEQKRRAATEDQSLRAKAEDGILQAEADEKKKQARIASIKAAAGVRESVRASVETMGQATAGAALAREQDALESRWRRLSVAVKENTADVKENARATAAAIRADVAEWQSWGGLIETQADANTRLGIEQDARLSASAANLLLRTAEQIDANKRNAASFKELRDAMEAVHAEEQYGTSVNMAYGASTMVLNAMMQPLIQTLQVYGTVNRENWRDLLAFTEDSKAAFAAQVQTALWSLAMQAGQKSIFEVGEQYREQALSLGALATGNFVGASVHMMSAAQHGVASTVYAGIAGASAGASVGVGMTRGEGGLFGLTKEERERKERDRGGGETRMPGQGGPAARGGGGGSDGPVVVNFVYEAGAIDARSRDAAAATVAEASRHARRSGFTNRMMRA